MVGEKIIDLLREWFWLGKDEQRDVDMLSAAANRAELDVIWNGLSKENQSKPFVRNAYNNRKLSLGEYSEDLLKPLEDFIKSALDSWITQVEQYSKADPTTAKDNLAKLSAAVIEVATASAAIDIGLGMLPNSAGQASSANTKQLLAWLGFGAVIAAVAHDPVKIGLLRPYQDSLEMTFRNRRPDDYALFQAYRTRELSPVKIEDLSKLTDAEMDRIEKENDAWYQAEIAKWGYSEWFANALARSATRTLGFAQLNTLARQGLLDRGLAIYSLWGEGLDRVVMGPALDALMAQNQMASYEGFRSLVEPSFVEGILEESDLITYWDKIRVPKDVQGWVLPRLRKRRDKFLAREADALKAKERDLTVSQLLALYREEKRGKVEIFNRITAMGYTKAEADELLELAEPSKKEVKPATLKRLPLSDYERAYKNKLIPFEAVLERMKGEYDPRDMKLEEDLLKKGVA